MSDSFAYFSHPKIQPSPGLQFEFGKWLAPYSDRTIISNPLSLQSDNQSITLFLYDKISNKTSAELSQEAYIVAVQQIIESCKRRSGKTVFSRIIEGKNQRLKPLHAASQLFASFPEAFGFLFSTPESGCWIGATPETLLNYDYRTRRVDTMAYAGTRPYMADAQWDDKNLRENQFVVDHIVDVFRSLGINPEVTDAYTSPYGNIQHLRRDISAILPPDVEYWQLLDALNPTPALCGTPTHAAIADINRCESADRGCYGGFVALHKPGEFFCANVCLRCAQLFAGGEFEIHAGGGITSDSVPLTEYRETEAKAAQLLKILTD